MCGLLQKVGDAFDKRRTETQEDLQRLRGLRPIDDDFMRCLFKDNIPLAELVLRIITGKPVYSIERINLDTGKPFEDGEHILYVNGEYRGVSDIGKLMHDFNCTDADEMNFELMAERTRYLKENPKGVSEMCKVIEDMRTQERKEAMIDTAKRMIADGILTLEKIAEYVGLSLDGVKNLQTGIMRK